MSIKVHSNHKVKYELFCHLALDTTLAFKCGH